MWFNHVAVDMHQQTSILPIPLALSPRRSGKSCQASTSWTILFTSSANLLNLQITSRKCPKSNMFWNWTKKINRFSPSVVSVWFMSFHCELGHNPTWHLKNTKPAQLWVLFYCDLGFACLQVLPSFPSLFHSAWLPVLLETQAAPCHLLRHACLPRVAPAFWATTPLPSPTLSL